MVEQLFEISKMEAAEYKLHKEPFVLSEIVQEIVNIFQLKANEKNVSLKCIESRYLVWINADIGLMERVVQNLVDNAVKNTPEKGKVELALEVENNNLIFKIENSGTPLPESLIDWINHSEDSKDAQYLRSENSGLGLSIVIKILTLHNSALQVSSQNNAGNLFSFRLDTYNPVSA
jgi:signal transduction histidine kinase